MSEILAEPDVGAEVDVSAGKESDVGLATVLVTVPVVIVAEMVLVLLAGDLAVSVVIGASLVE